MSTLKIFVLCAALCMTPALAAPTNGGHSPQPGQDGSAGQDEAVVEVSNILVAEIDSLPKSVREEVDAKIAQTTEKELQELRHSLSAIPAATTALGAKGKKISDVVAAALDHEGALLIVTTTEI
jgi:hypothetical protein